LASQFNTRYDQKQTFTFTGKSGNQLTGISPDLPELSGVFESTVLTAQRDTNNTMTIETATDHGFNVGEYIRVQGMSSDLTTTGIKVDVASADTATQVAAKAAAIINNETDFSAFSVGDTITITNTANGVTTDAADVDAGVTVTVTQQGTVALPEITEVVVGIGSIYDVVDTSLRFNINSADDTTQYHVWFNVADGANEQINVGLDDLPESTYEVVEILSNTEFKIFAPGVSGNGNGGVVRTDRIGMADSGSLVYLTSARLGTGILGPNIWDPDAAFVLSSLTSTIQQEINAGTTVRTLEVASPNNIPDEEGFVIFDFGTEDQEGPVRYLFKPTDNSLQLDPAYIFEKNHEIGSGVTVIRRRGAHVISTTGREYAPYLTDPGTAREILQELLRSVKSVGIFIDFLIRFPQQLYATLDVYRSCSDTLFPITVEDRENCESNS
jgi:hypothetical protein